MLCLQLIEQKSNNGVYKDCADIMLDVSNMFHYRMDYYKSLGQEKSKFVEMAEYYLKIVYKSIFEKLKKNLEDGSHTNMYVIHSWLNMML